MSDTKPENKKSSHPFGEKRKNQNARLWIAGHLYSDVNVAMNHLIEQITASGEL